RFDVGQRELQPWSFESRPDAIQITGPCGVSRYRPFLWRCRKQRREREPQVRGEHPLPDWIVADQNARAGVWLRVTVLRNCLADFVAGLRFGMRALRGTDRI